MAPPNGDTSFHPQPSSRTRLHSTTKPYDRPSSSKTSQLLPSSSSSFLSGLKGLLGRPLGWVVGGSGSGEKEKTVRAEKAGKGRGSSDQTRTTKSNGEAASTAKQMMEEDGEDYSQSSRREKGEKLRTRQPPHLARHISNSHSMSSLPHSSSYTSAASQSSNRDQVGFERSGSRSRLVLDAKMDSPVKRDDTSRLRTGQARDRGGGNEPWMDRYRMREDRSPAPMSRLQVRGFVY